MKSLSKRRYGTKRVFCPIMCSNSYLPDYHHDDHSGKQHEKRARYCTVSQKTKRFLNQDLHIYIYITSNSLTPCLMYSLTFSENTPHAITVCSYTVHQPLQQSWAKRQKPEIVQSYKFHKNKLLHSYAHIYETF